MNFEVVAKCIPTLCCGILLNRKMIFKINPLLLLRNKNGWIHANYICPSCGRINTSDLNDCMQIDIKSIRPCL